MDESTERLTSCATERRSESEAAPRFRILDDRRSTHDGEGAPPGRVASRKASGAEHSGTTATLTGLPAPSRAQDAPAALAPAGDAGTGLRPLLSGRGWTALELGTDLLASLMAVLLALLVSEGAGGLASHPWLLAFPVVLVGALALRGLYHRSVQPEVLNGLGPIVGAVSVASMLLLGPAILGLGDAATTLLLARIWGFALLLVVPARAALVLLQRAAHKRRLLGKPTLIVGAGPVGAKVARRLQERPECGLHPVGFLDADPPSGIPGFERRAPVLGPPAELAAVARATNAQHVVFAFTSAPDRGLVPLARRCEELGLEVSLVPRFFETTNDRIRLGRVGTMPLFRVRSVDPKSWQFELKYALDRVLAALLLVVLAPLMTALAVAVKLSSSGPVWFRQQRVGRDGHSFDLYKFRSMLVEEEAGTFQLRPGSAPGGIEGRDRRTLVGRFLRRSSLDELPQLVNVLKGEMSLVGPRPERPDFVAMFGRDIARYGDRHRVKSGITGWAQVSGLRGQSSIQERIEWDNVYIENWTPWFDVKILLLTVGAVLRTGHDA